MSKDAVYAVLTEILVSEFEIDSSVISPEKQLYNDLELDSLDAVDIIVSIKDHLEGKIDPALFKDARTVQDLVDILHPIWKDG
jgi:acyl carrier protein